MPLLDDITNHLKQMGFDFRINDLDETLEFRRDEGDWQRMSDTIEATIRTKWRELEYEGRKPSIEAMRDAYITYADQKRYNPIKDYFLSLEGKYLPSEKGPYAIPDLCKYFSNPDGLLGRWLFKWMTGAIAKVFRGERNPMLVLVSPQHIGKSSFTQWICPLPKYFLKSGINPDNKDANLRLAEVLVQEVEELGATTRRADMEALKAFITKPFIFERPPYGRHPIHKPVMTNFIGTVNADGVGFLNDPTGSTRFLTCEIESIDFRYTSMDVHYIWAEAYWYYRNMPDCWKLTQEDMKLQAEMNEQFEMILVLEDAVETRLEVTNNPEDFLTTQSIQAHLLGFHNISNDQIFQRELAKVLYKKKCKPGRGKHVEGKPHLRGWYGVRTRKDEKGN